MHVCLFSMASLRDVTVPDADMISAQMARSSSVDDYLLSVL